MSNLLERAIVDAKALREAALKSAEKLVIEKYSDEVKTAVNRLIEQDDIMGLEDPSLDMGAVDTGEDFFDSPEEDFEDNAEEGEELEPLDPESIMEDL